MWSWFTGDRIYLDSNSAVTSELTLAEMLAKPLEVAAHSLVDAFERTLGPESPIFTRPIARSTLRRAAELQASRKIRLLDAIHVATAEESACDFFLSQDDRLGRGLPSALRWLNLAGMSGEEER